MNLPTKGKQRAGDTTPPASAPAKLEADGAEKPPAPLAAPAPSAAETQAEQASAKSERAKVFADAIADKPAGKLAHPELAPEAKATSLRYKVWAHGTLQRDGKTYQSGDELTLLVDEAAKIPCLEPA
jgi:hypothetical protein